MIRAYVEHRLDQRPGVQKLCYIGPMFRRERPQKGRHRQFHRIGAEAIGSESPAVDAEVIEMVVEVHRPQHIERLRRELKFVAPRMCGDCHRRADANPLRRPFASGRTDH